MSKRGKRGRKGGRPRKEGRRFPSGRLDNRAGATEELLAKRKRFIGRADPRHHDAEWYVGQLYLRGLVTEEQRDAAADWYGLIRRYSSLLCAPRQPTSVMFGFPGGQGLDDPEEFERVKTRYDRCYHAVAERGRNVLRATMAAMRDERTDPGLVADGLDALCRVTGYRRAS